MTPDGLQWCQQYVRCWRYHLERESGEKPIVIKNLVKNRILVVCIKSTVMMKDFRFKNLVRHGPEALADWGLNLNSSQRWGCGLVGPI